jgi:hypothetical protein
MWKNVISADLPDANKHNSKEKVRINWFICQMQQIISFHLRKVEKKTSFPMGKVNQNR